MKAEIVAVKGLGSKQTMIDGPPGQEGISFFGLKELIYNNNKIK
jgi:hypothetical protein